MPTPNLIITPLATAGEQVGITIDIVGLAIVTPSQQVIPSLGGSINAATRPTTITRTRLSAATWVVPVGTTASLYRLQQLVDPGSKDNPQMGTSSV